MDIFPAAPDQAAEVKVKLKGEGVGGVGVGGSRQEGQRPDDSCCPPT